MTDANKQIIKLMKDALRLRSGKSWSITSVDTDLLLVTTPPRRREAKQFPSGVHLVMPLSEQAELATLLGFPGTEWGTTIGVSSEDKWEMALLYARGESPQDDLAERVRLAAEADWQRRMTL